MKQQLAISFLICLFPCAGCRHNEGMTPLLLAAHSGNAGEVKALISDDARLNETSRYGWTALIFAAREGHDNVVDSLLRAGANPNIVSEEVPSGFMATRGGHPPTTALREAIQNQHFGIANRLLDNGARIDPVSFALAGGAGDIPLLERFLALGADINQPSDNQFHRSPLCEAAGAGDLKAVKWLVDHGADPNLIAVRETALGNAVSKDHVDIVAYLLDKRADPNLVFNNMKDTALHVAVTKHTDDKNYDKNLAVVRTLLSHGADRSHKAYGDHTALEFIRIQRENNLKYIPKAETEDIRERHKASLRHKDAIIALLDK